MRKKIIWLLVSCLMVLSLVLLSCGEEEEEEVTVPTEEEEVALPTEEEEEVVVPPGEGNWWDKFGEPEYGDTLTWRLPMDITSFDKWFANDYVGITALYTEALTMMGWTADRETCPYTGGETPMYCRENLLMESFELDNYQKYTIRIKEGIHWFDKPPVNGRELTAYDFEYAWNRITAMGGGFTKKALTYFKGYDDAESVYATDKYTIVFQLKYPAPGWWGPIGNDKWFASMPHEVIEQYGDLTDWKNVQGTGPFMLINYVAGSSATYTRNPNYWGYDQRHPENKIPYVDGVKLLIIPDQSTAYAALRTGKICMIPGVPWEQAESLEKTNPELKEAAYPISGWAVTMRIDKEPFTDIRVRKALNMSLDLKTIAETYYGGRVEGKPYSSYGPSAGPYYTPFEDWPEDLQEGHTYNPEGARKLLAEAGYPNGFKTNIVISSANDLDLPQIIKGYFSDIGVDMEIRVVESTVFFSYVNFGKKHDQMVWSQTGPAAAGGWLPQFSGKMIGGMGLNVCMIDDPVLTELIDREALFPFDSEGKISCNKQADMYAMNLYLTVNTLPYVGYTFYQPWLKGYAGEKVSSPDSALFARWWIDQELKKAIGH